jgi:hypothetical protein
MSCLTMIMIMGVLVIRIAVLILARIWLNYKVISIIRLC